MKLLIPNPPLNPSRPQWWLIHLESYRRPVTGWTLDLLLRLRWISIQIRRNATVDNLTSPVPHFVRSTRYSVRYIMHPNGGSTCKLICDECGAEYPFPSGRLAYPCAFCAVERESKLRVWWKRNPVVREGDMLYTQWWSWPKPKLALTAQDREELVG